MSQVDTVVRYIRNQAEHHRRRSFEEEFVLLLKKAGIEYDPATIFE
jgi:putative transposase